MKFHMVPDAPTPVAPFSHAVESDGFVFLTGMMPDTPQAAGVLPDGIADQTRNCMANLRTVLGSLGLTLADVVSVRAYLTEFYRDYDGFNDTYADFFPENRRPARTCIGVTGLAYGALVEIDMVARRPAD
ncbi:MAG: RidA family protein [Pseudomonadota bacterium]